MWLNCCENWRGSKKFKVPKKNPKLQEIFHLKKTIEVQKRNSKFKWENGTKEENQEFQKSKRDFKGKWWNKFFKKGWIWMMNFLYDVDFRNNEFFWKKKLYLSWIMNSLMCNVESFEPFRII